ncbi:hypothetical protein GCM10027176_09660 [Actinoallomurus bryophytorum]
MGNSDHPNHTVLARRLHAYLRWRNTNARHPDILAAQRRERARIRSERGQRWGRPPPQSRMITPGEVCGHPTRDSPGRDTYPP